MFSFVWNGLGLLIIPFAYLISSFNPVLHAAAQGVFLIGLLFFAPAVSLILVRQWLAIPQSDDLYFLSLLLLMLLINIIIVWLAMALFVYLKTRSRSFRNYDHL